MKIEHLAIWVNDLERMRLFYETYFGGKAGKRYHNPAKNFTSYFLSFEQGPRLELMHRPDMAQKTINREEQIGITHFAVSVGAKARVDELTEKLRESGFKVIGEPRSTGDGYYESVVLDPEFNRIEITV
ncbi:MAG: VOC family protein [Maribacter sp.]|nr:VOC family protein [Maribacter sp.]